jgi:hypothetical protein
VSGLEPLGPIAEALESALESLQGVSPQDAALRALARRYACDIDEAPAVALDAQRCVEDLMRHRQGPIDPVLLDRIRRVHTRIEQTTVLASLGPKLNQSLTDLGMTPRSRSAVGKTDPGAAKPGNEGNKAVKPQDELARIRNARTPPR